MAHPRSRKTQRRSPSLRATRASVGGAHAICLHLLLTLALGFAAPAHGEMHVVLLGTGTPFADPEHSGPATAVIVDDDVWIVDAGPGVVRRAAAAVNAGEAALDRHNLSRLLITHLHSDHTLGLPDLMYSPWTLGRSAPLRIWGPPGTEAMVGHIEQAWSVDRRMRLEGAQPANATGWQARVETVRAGPIHRDDRVEITAIPACHGEWPDAFAFHFRHGAQTLLISGDTALCPAIREAATGVDVLVHEVYDADALARRTEAWQAYHGAAHTSGPDVGRLATDAGVGRLVLYHQLMFTGSRAAIETQVRSTWKGDLVWGEDLTVITWPEAEPAATTASPPLDADARLVDSRGADRSPPRPPEP